MLLLTLGVPAVAAPPNEQPEMPPEVPPSESAPAPNEPAPPTVPVPAPVPATGAATTERLEDLEQLVRIEARKRELAEEAAAAKRGEGPVLIADERGFALKAADASYVLRLRGQLQFDSRFYFREDTLEANDTFLIRRFRPTLEGTLFSLVDFRFVPELAGTPTILEAYLDVHPRPWGHFRVGKFKTPIGLERLQSDADLPIVERALDSNLSSQRDVGALVWGDLAGGVVQYIAGVVNGTADTTAGDTDLDHAKDFLGRLFILPFAAPSLRDFGSLAVGVAAQSGNRKGRLPTAVPGLPIPSVAAQTGLAPFKTFGQNTFFSYYAPATDTTGASTTFTHGRTTHLNPQLFYYYDNFGLLAEYLYLWQGVQRSSGTTTLKQQAAHATVTYAIGGRESFEGTTPLEPFDPAKGAPGAFLIAARWDWIRLDPATFGNPAVPGSTAYADPIKSAASAQSFAGGVAWIPRRTVRFAIDFARTRFEGGNGTPAVAATPGVPATPAVVTDRKTENALIGRAQINF
jgi:phosphate-selective porin OprO/OprP